MYAHHFGLAAEPFSLTPDPDFLYLGSAHAEALAAMNVGLLGKRGVLVMTGEVGTGKTTLLYALLRALGDDMRTAYVANTAMGFDGILHLALADFGVTPSSHARVDMLTALNRMLRDCAERGVTATLIVDEAQNLDPEAFEQLRLLSNFETFTHKLLQIVLVGQPELEARLRQPALRALAERVAIHCQLAPLSECDSRAYLDYRLLRAGGATRLFDRDARDLLLAAAQGLPRRINILCHNALLFAYGRGDARVTRSVAQLAVAGRAALLQEDPPPAPARPPMAPAARRAPRAALALGGAVMVAALAVVGLRAPAWLSAAGHANEPPAFEAGVAAAWAPEQAGLSPAEIAPPGSAGTVAGSFPRVAPAPPEPADEAQGETLEGSSRGVSTGSPEAEAASPAEPAADGDRSASAASLALPAGDSSDSAVVPAEEAAPALTEEPAPAPAEAPAAVLTEDGRRLAGAPPAPTEDRAAQPDVTLRFRTVRVEPGSTLESLAREVYGGVDSELIKRIQAANPRVVDPNLIMAGDLLHFPEAAPERPAAEKGESQ